MQRAFLYTAAFLFIPFHLIALAALGKGKLGNHHTLGGPNILRQMSNLVIGHQN